jgi:hypothetical protein
VLDRQKAKEFLAKREAVRAKRVGLTNVRETDNGTVVHSTGRNVEKDDV